MDLQLFISPTRFIIRRGRTDIGYANFNDLTFTPTPAATEADLAYVPYILADYVAGEVMNVRPCVGTVLGPLREFTHEVMCHAVGNPDYQQYADIGRRKIVRCVGVEEACEIVKAYQKLHEMGGGNCPPHHGKVWELPRTAKGRRRLVGYVCYNGSFETTAERKKWEADFKKKYPNTKLA